MSKSLFIRLKSWSVLLGFCAMGHDSMAMEDQATQPQTVSEENPVSHECARHEFINYFHFLDKSEALTLIEQSFTSILRRLNVSYFDPQSNTLSQNNFFQKLNELAQEKAPGSKIYITGSVVRSLLGYIYKKLYHEHQVLLEANNERALTKEEMHDMTLSVFKRIISGQSRKQPEQIDKELLSVRTLGIGNDLNILIEFPESFAGNKEQILQDLNEFTNSAVTYLGMGEYKGDIKKAIALMGEVKDYQETFVDQGNKNKILQGGVTLDWLAFPVTNDMDQKFRFPGGDENQQIMTLFLEGQVDYRSPQVALQDSDKQTVRGLRPLMEVPFLKFTPKGMLIMSQELKALILRVTEAKKNVTGIITHEMLPEKGILSQGAVDEFGKLIRQARFEGAHNRFVNPIRCLSENEIENLVYNLSTEIGGLGGEEDASGGKKLPLIPEFLVNKKISANRGDKGNLEAQGYLMPVDEFIDICTDKGIVYHGTPEIQYVLRMVLNGLIPSTSKQGSADEGRGFYTVKEIGSGVNTPTHFASTDGLVIPFKIRRNLPLRILDLRSEKGKELLKQLNPDLDTSSGFANRYWGRKPAANAVFETLVNKYDIDIILYGVTLIQNTAAVEMPKNTAQVMTSMIENWGSNIKNICSSKNSAKWQLNYDFISSFLNHTNPHKWFMKLTRYLNPKINTEVSDELKQCLMSPELEDNMRNILQEAVYYRDVHTIKWLFEKLPSDFMNKLFLLPDKSFRFGESLFQKVDDPEVVKIVFHYIPSDLKSTLYTPDSDGRTLLHNILKRHAENYSKHKMDEGKEIIFKNWARTLNEKQSTIRYYPEKMDNLINTIFKNDLEIVSIILENLPNDSVSHVFSPDSHMQTILHYAVLSGNSDMVKLIFKYLPSEYLHKIFSKDSDNMTLLHYAVKLNNIDIVNMIFENVPDDLKKELFARDRYKKTPLHYAAFLADTDILKLLMDKVPNGYKDELFALDNGNLSPLNYAALSGNVEGFKFLFENAPNNIRNRLYSPHDISRNIISNIAYRGDKDDRYIGVLKVLVEKMPERIRKKSVTEDNKKKLSSYAKKDEIKEIINSIK